jgi:hypothetical protein
MGMKPLQDDDEGSPNLRPAPRLVHRRCVRSSFLILIVSHAFDGCRSAAGGARFLTEIWNRDPPRSPAGFPR